MTAQRHRLGSEAGGLQVVAFRLMLVFEVALALCFGGAWMLNNHRESQASEAVARSFDDYNRFIDACGNEKTGVVWDLAVSARTALDRATADRDRYARRRDAWAWIGLSLGLGLVSSFYALRWALTGRVRPLWLLGRGTRHNG